MNTSQVLNVSMINLTVVFVMVNMEMHAIHETPVVVSQTSASRSPDVLDSDIMRILTKEMEDIIVEDVLKSEVGPVKTTWDAVIDKERRKRDTRLRGIKLPSPPLETRQMRSHNRARSLSL